MANERLSLGDHHTHAQDLCFHNKTSAKAFGIEVGDHLYPDVGAQKYVDHVRRNNLDTIWLIYESTQRYSRIQKAIKNAYPECQVKGFYFVRDVKKVNEEKLKKLHKEGLLHGIKLHPVIDNYALVPENIDTVAKIAKELNVPVIFHSDDRAKSMHLTSPANQIEIANTYPDVRFVIGHGGAYAHPRLVGETNSGTQAYWYKPERSARDLVISALKLATTKENMFYEFSIVRNRIKAKLISDFVKETPKASRKILAGSDYPTAFARLDSQFEALTTAGMSMEALLQIASNRL